MKLGELNKSRFQRRVACDRAMMSKIHKRCYRCCSELKGEKSNESNNIEEHCINHNDNEHKATMQKRGNVDSIKNLGSVRLFCVNPKGLGPKNYEKMQMLM